MIIGRMAKQYGFVLADYLVCGSVVLICMGIGLYYAITGGKRQTTTDYLLGNRRLKMLPVAFSLVVSFESSILMLGYPAEIYIYGAIVLLTSFSYIITCSYFGSKIAVPIFHPLKITSVYEYLELRYKHRAPRILCTIIGMLYYLFYMGIVLYGPALALEAVIGFPLTSSILVVAAASMIYTAMGGIRAVIWTDVLQCVIMNTGIIAVIIQCTIYSGGFKSAWEINKKYKRLNFFDFRADPTIRHTTWNLIIGTIFRSCVTVFNQTSIQRISAVRTQREATLIFHISGLVFGLIGVLINFEGQTIFSYFNTIGCDPIESKQIANPNQIVPFVIVRIFDKMPGMAGLYMAALLSAALSTLSSGLSSLSAQLTEDFVKPLFKDMSDVRAAVVAKVSVLMFGGLAVGISFIIANVEGSLLQIGGSILTSFSGPVSGMFLYSIFCPWATKNGVLIGGITSMAFVFWMSYGQNFSKTLHKQPWLPHNPIDNCFVNQSSYMVNQSSYLVNASTYQAFDLRGGPSVENYDKLINEYWNQSQEGLDQLYALSYTWFAFITIMTTILVGSIVSLIQGCPDPEEVDVRYILPIGDTIFPYLPKRIRTYLNCGVPFHKRDEWLKNIQKQEMDNHSQDEATVMGDKQEDGETHFMENDPSKYSDTSNFVDQGFDKKSSDGNILEHL